MGKWRYIYCIYIVDIGDLILRNIASQSHSNYFYRNWSDYRQGFGSPDSLYWIGLERLHDLSLRGCAVRFDLQDLHGAWYHAQYSTFVVGDSVDYYRLLSVGGFTGDARLDDTLYEYHKNLQFSTFDYGPVRGCATQFYGGWWFKNCCTACLTYSGSDYRQFGWGDNILKEAVVRFVC